MHIEHGLSYTLSPLTFFGLQNHSLALTLVSENSVYLSHKADPSLCPWPQLFLRTRLCFHSFTAHPQDLPPQWVFPSKYRLNYLNMKEQWGFMYSKPRMLHLLLSTSLNCVPSSGAQRAVLGPLWVPWPWSPGTTDPNPFRYPSMLIHLLPSPREDYAPIEATHSSLHWLIS